MVVFSVGELQHRMHESLIRSLTSGTQNKASTGCIQLWMLRINDPQKHIQPYPLYTTHPLSHNHHDRESWLKILELSMVADINVKKVTYNGRICCYNLFSPSIQRSLKDNSKRRWFNAQPMLLYPLLIGVCIYIQYTYSRSGRWISDEINSNSNWFQKKNCRAERVYMNIHLLPS